MKTLDEALKATFTLNERPVDGDMPLPFRDALDLARDLMASKEATEYLAEIVNIAIDKLLDANPEPPSMEEFFNFSMGVALTAFLAGVRVGQAMEKEDLEP